MFPLLIAPASSRSRRGPPGGTLLRSIAVVALIGVTVFAAAAPGAGIDLRVHRTWMPEAYPSSYAIGFPSGLNFCFDPIRGNLIYAWQGDYVDLSPTVNGKLPRDAVIQGKKFYQSLTTSGFRTGNGDAEPEIRFRSFRVRRGVPEFEYDVDGVRVWEAIRPSADGTSFVREFHVTTPDRSVSYRSSDPTHVSIQSGTAKWIGNTLSLPGNSTVVFSVPLPRS